MKIKHLLIFFTIAIFSSNSFADWGKWSKHARPSGGSVNCIHVSHITNTTDIAKLTIKHTPDKCQPNGSPIEPNCAGAFGTDQPIIKIDGRNATKTVKTQVITTNDWIRLIQPNWPISMIFNSKLSRGETKTLRSSISAPGSRYACRIGS